MKKQSFPLFMLVTILLLLAGVTQASARAEVPGGMMELRKDQAVTSMLREDENRDDVKYEEGSEEIEVEYEGDEDRNRVRPALYNIPEGEEGEMMRKGAPAQIEQMLPLQVQEKRMERSQERLQREEELRYMGRSERAKERMSDVATRVQELLANPDREGGIGQDIRDIAREQQDGQGNLEANLEDVYSRNRFLKFIIGTNRSALNEVKKEANEIDGRIAKLKALEGTVEGEEQDQLLGLIDDLEGQRNDLLETIEAEDASYSMFGWMRRLFSQN